MDAHLDALIAFFSAHPELALGAVFAASFLEAVAIIGTVVPGSTVVFAGGALVGLKVLDPWVVAITAIVGAILGDGISYWLGHRYHGAIRTMWPMSRYPALFARGEAYFAVHGGKSVFFGRFLGPLRAIVPVVAGMANMPPGQFYLMNALSAVAWAAAHMLPGVLFGASLEVAGAVSSRLVALIALVVVGAWLIAQIVRLVTRLAVPHLEGLRDHVVARAQQSGGRTATAVLALIDPARRESMPLLIAATLLIGGAWLFLSVIANVVTRDTLGTIDRSIFDGLQALRTGWADDLMIRISGLGSALVVVAIVVVVATLLAITRRWRTLGYWIAAAAFAELLTWALNLGFEHARPELDYSLIADHAAVSIVVYGFLGFLLGHGKSGWQKFAIAVPVASIAVLVSFARLYLGAHVFSDVAAGMGLGIAWMALLCIAYITHVREPPIGALAGLLTVSVTLVFFGNVYWDRDHARDLARFAKPVMLRTLVFAEWRGGAWLGLPAARSEFTGQREEPFTIQWAASPADLERQLAAAQWRRPAAWDSQAALFWLLPSTPVDELPVLPKFHQGQPPGLTMMRPVDPQSRLVVRFWWVANVTDQAGSLRPLWEGTATLERARTEFGLIATARTSTDVATPSRAIEAAARAAHANVDVRERAGIPALLIW